MRWFVAILGLTTLITGCVYESTEVPRVEVSAIKAPPGFPVVPYPDDNVPTAEKIELGRRLFFDPILSIDSSIACASCHFPDHAFSDIKALSTGVDGKTGFRNAPPLFNLAYQPNYFQGWRYPFVGVASAGTAGQRRRNAYGFPGCRRPAGATSGISSLI